MYHIKDKRSYVKEIQKYLNVYADSTGKEKIYPDGFMNDRTKNAVRDFQKENGLTENGRVDKSTHKLLHERFKQEMLIKNAKRHVISESAFPLKRDMQSNDVMVLNLYLEELRKVYENISPVNRTRYFDVFSERAVRDLQKIFGQKESGEVDLAFFERLRRELYLINSEKQA